jgi:hypothetical protein
VPRFRCFACEAQAATACLRGINDVDPRTRKITHLIPVIHLSPFEIWAKSEGYDTAPVVLPTPDRHYADGRTKAVFDAWNAGAKYVAVMVT